MIKASLPFHFQNREAGLSTAAALQLLVIIGIIVGTLLMANEIKYNAFSVMTISRVKSYDTAVGTFRRTYGALPGDIVATNRVPNCTELPCAAPGNGNNVVADVKPLISTPFYFTNTSENRTFWLHLAEAGLITGVKKGGGKGRYFGEWGYEFPGAPFGIGGGFHIAYYSVTSTPFSLISLLGHYMVLRPSTDTYGVNAVPFAISPILANVIDRKIDDGRPLTGNVIAPGSNNCATNANVYNEVATSRECNLLMRLSF